MHPKLLIILCAIVISACNIKSPQIPWVNADRRPSGTILDDKKIALAVNKIISGDKQLWNESHINILSFHNSLLLVGQTPRHGNKQKIDQLLGTIPEVTHIYNEITVEPCINITTRINDSWLTTQIKAKFLSEPDLGANKVKVLTENSVVYLMGILTPQEESIAINITRKVKGVKSVVKLTKPYNN